MRRDLFGCIMHFVAMYDPWFVQKHDGSERLELSTLQKCTAAIRILTYCMPADACDNYYKIGESTMLQCIKRFVIAICACF